MAGFRLTKISTVYKPFTNRLKRFDIIYFSNSVLDCILFFTNKNEEQ